MDDLVLSSTLEAQSLEPNTDEKTNEKRMEAQKKFTEEMAKDQADLIKKHQKEREKILVHNTNKTILKHKQENKIGTKRGKK